jgi:hypothetical protein
MDKEYIERYNAMKICQQYSKHCFDTNDAKGQDVADKIEWDIIKLSTADVVEVKHGYWKWKELYGEVGYMLVCSECEESEGACERYDYCPNCGAKMDKKEE